jgi:hypothetical protein
MLAAEPREGCTGLYMSWQSLMEVALGYIETGRALRRLHWVRCRHAGWQHFMEVELDQVCWLATPCEDGTGPGVGMLIGRVSRRLYWVRCRHADWQSLAEVALGQMQAC